jgi:hypothetical protein
MGGQRATKIHQVPGREGNRRQQAPFDEVRRVGVSRGLLTNV